MGSRPADTSLSPIQRGFAPGFVNCKKGALDSQPQVIKLTSCFPMVGGSLVSSTFKTGRHDIAEILLKVALNTKNQSNHYFFLYLFIRGIDKKIFSYNFIWEESKRLRWWAKRFTFSHVNNTVTCIVHSLFGISKTSPFEYHTITLLQIYKTFIPINIFVPICQSQ